MEAICVNHPGTPALSVCHSCNRSHCKECLTEGLVYYCCGRPECQARLHDDELPGVVVCPSCMEELELTPEERKEKRFWCLRCKQFFDVSAPDEAKADLSASSSVWPSEPRCIRYQARARFVNTLLLTSIVVGLSEVLLFR